MGGIHVKRQRKRGRGYGPVSCNRSLDDHVLYEIPVVDHREIHGLGLARNDPNFLEGVHHEAVFFADVAEDVGGKIETGFDVGHPNGCEIIGSREGVAGRCETHPDGGLVARTDLNDGGCFKHEINLTGVGRVKIHTERSRRVAIVADDDAGRDGLSDGEVHRLAGGRERGIDLFTHTNGHFKGGDVGARGHLKDIDADGFDAVGGCIRVRGEDQREGRDVGGGVGRVVGHVGWNIRYRGGGHDAASAERNVPAVGDLVVQHQAVRRHVVARVGEVDVKRRLLSNHGIKGRAVVTFNAEHRRNGDGQGLRN